MTSRRQLSRLTAPVLVLSATLAACSTDTAKKEDTNIAPTNVKDQIARQSEIVRPNDCVFARSFKKFCQGAPNPPP